ncbi:MAG: tetratricopeptide repeat protein [Bacteroidetes bacterium]|nr:tetratricopeptide repeat protein [Bacteroidota bacterium]
MTHNEEKIKADKFALIYEFNENSPLFSRVAAKHLQNSEPEKALPILEAGLKKHPDYPTALIIYSLTLAKLRNKEKAKEIITRLSDIINSEETVVYYLNKINDIHESDVEINFNLEEKNEAEINKENSPDITPNEDKIKLEMKKADNDDLQDLADRLSKASIPVITESEAEHPELTKKEEEPEFPGKSLVSETLAKIYFNQGNFNEALSIYETLIEIQPEKSEYYQKQISKIKEQLNNK